MRLLELRPNYLQLPRTLTCRDKLEDPWRDLELGRGIELRNPSDALDVLAHSDDRSLLATTRGPANYGTSSTPNDQEGGNQSATLKGLELLKVCENIHPYCPIVPEKFLTPMAVEQIAKPDHFLLTIVLTIASRDAS
ncbi:hypothetical protein BU25DRAFT_259959 [Macroventuria anomochaeta]|uniref:Uncharacterized protein n=1 Tax=Macroventuria anomochaeta TaxID=301207 RepID=A0ACB6S6F1_9PLEO|nr:uncharacterized protein BU25DRAFT_259959 [Macroventuria anomochaeta]KAF2629856.1 hypothetical protein BU25DRAFT_259959 [Macroventuria anomochaeta]